MRTRFAPSPTGKLHLGHVLAAWVAYRLAKGEGGGAFLLRHEDIDHTRVREEYYGMIEEDLRWLGLAWDGEVVRQSERVQAYEGALERLREMGVVYPCFCTRKEIEEEVVAMVGAPQGEGMAKYGGRCRRMSQGEVEERMGKGDKYAWRLDASKAGAMVGALSFEDLRYGRVEVDADRLGDVVLARKDIGSSYHLAVVVDDGWQEISHVTRGEDLLESTHVHRVLQALLGMKEPVYLHHRLVVDEGGKRLAKRHDALAVSVMRERGMEVGAIFDLLRGYLP